MEALWSFDLLLLSIIPVTLSQEYATGSVERISSWDRDDEQRAKENKAKRVL